MFNLDRLIEMVKKGEFPNKPFNIRKKAGEEEFGEEYIRRTTDAPKAEQSYEESFERVPQVKEDISFDLSNRLTEEQKLNAQKIDEAMNLWVQQNTQSMGMEATEGVEALEHKRDKRSEDSLLKTDKFIVDEMRKDPNLITTLTNKIDQNVPLEPEMPLIFVATMLAKHQKKEEVTEKAPADFVEPVRPVSPTDAAPVADANVGSDVMYDDITLSVMRRFNPDSLEETGDLDNVLDALSPKGKGVGKMYNPTNFQVAVEKMFGVPKGNNVDQRMNFFLVNSDLLAMPFFPNENPQYNIFQQVPGLEEGLRAELNKFGIGDEDIISGLKRASAQKADQARGIPSPKGPITRALQLYAEPELHEILQQLIGRTDPSIVQWFKPKLQYAMEETGAKLNVNEETSNLGIGPGEEMAIKEKATPEQKSHAANQVAAIVDSYLVDQLDTMDIMKDSIVGNMMAPEVNKYMELKNGLATVRSPEEKTQVENNIKNQMGMYILTESLNGFSNYTIVQLRQLFKDATGVSAGKKYYAPGSEQKDTMINFTNDFGKANVPSDIIETIFKGDKSGSEKINPSDYVKGYINQINSGEITDPYSPDWSKMIQRKVPYNVFADMYMLKSEIKGMHDRGLARRPEGAYSGEDVITSIYNDLEKDVASRKMLEDFSGIVYEDRNSSLQIEQKKKNFIRMTLDQTNKNLNRYESCYKARKKYNDLREEVKNKHMLTDEERKEEISAINREEKEGKVYFKDDKDGNIIVDKKGLPKKFHDYSVLKNVKWVIGSIMWPLLPSILNNIENSQATNIFEMNAEKSFLDLFDHGAKQYERYTDIGKNINPFDEQGRSNTELYYLVRDGRIPVDIQKIIDFTKKSKMTENDKIYINNLNYIFGLKKKLRKNQDLLDKATINKENYIVNRLSYMARDRVNKIRFEKNPNEQAKLLSRIPPEKLQEFKNKVISEWDGYSGLSDEYYLWLGLKGPVKSKNTFNSLVNKYQNSVDKVLNDITVKEVANAKVKRLTTASKTSYLRLVHAEYKKALSKIDKLHKIKKFSYKFASVDVSSIDDTILDIEKNFESLLDTLIR